MDAFHLDTDKLTAACEWWAPGATLDSATFLTPGEILDDLMATAESSGAVSGPKRWSIEVYVDAGTDRAQISLYHEITRLRVAGDWQKARFLADPHETSIVDPVQRVLSEAGKVYARLALLAKDLPS